MTDFIDFLHGNVPRWALADNGGRLLDGALGVMGNMLADQQLRAVCAGLLASDQSPDDILPAAGKERGGLWRYPGETADQYRSRLLNAATTWQCAGADRAIEEQLELAGFTGADVVFYTDRIGPHGEGQPYRSHFWVYIPLSTLRARPGWMNDPTWAECVWGCFWWGYGAMGVDDAQLFWAIVNKFKPVDHVCRGVAIV
jgi:hypothetical protein